MTGGGKRRGGGGGGNSDPCQEQYLLDLKDWQLQYPSNQLVPSLPDPTPVDLKPHGNNNTVEVWDLAGNKLGHIYRAGLKKCIEENSYDGVFVRVNAVPHIRVAKRP